MCLKFWLQAVRDPGLQRVHAGLPKGQDDCGPPGAAEFLNLRPQEAQFVELKLALAVGVRQLREQHGMTQAALAEQVGSSQSRVAKMEAADRPVTVDPMMRSLLAIGATPREIARLIKRVETHRAA